MQKWGPIEVIITALGPKFFWEDLEGQSPRLMVDEITGSADLWVKGALWGGSLSSGKLGGRFRIQERGNGCASVHGGSTDSSMGSDL